ncbi:MAG: zinc ribbon domain-containing protein [Clostridiales bacterium]|nr:zinc ribbon domain-containing protein [Clostridiales bacterium]MDY2872761.1 zinc ribbon domain-containing protein [Eubacteriales bacterium]
METKDVIINLRTARGLSQEALAERVFVTRQAVSRWETGETTPNTETLKLLSGLFGVSINTLLGAPRRLICQCCGMPLSEDGLISRETDGAFNEDYCKWCYDGGEFAYKSKDALVDFLMSHMPNPDNVPDETRRAQYDAWLSQLSHWAK